MINSKEEQIDLLLEHISVSDDQITSSVMLQRIVEFSRDSYNRNNHSEHDNHCQFDRDGGGGHANVCWMDETIKSLIGNNDEE